MKQIGAEIGVNESRVSQLHARAIRRLRDALASTMPGAEVAKVMRSASSGVPAEAAYGEGQARQRRRGQRYRAAGRGRRLRERLADAPRQISGPERPGEPAAAALFQEACGVGIAGDGDRARGRERRARGSERAIGRRSSAHACIVPAVRTPRCQSDEESVQPRASNAGSLLVWRARPVPARKSSFHRRPPVRPRVHSREAARHDFAGS